jgi:hypothetical protein
MIKCLLLIVALAGCTSLINIGGGSIKQDMNQEVDSNINASRPAKIK